MLEKMSEMIAEQLNCDAAGITAETSFKDDLGADSLDLFELGYGVWKMNTILRSRLKILQI